MKIHESAENYLETILMLSQRKAQVRSIDIVNELGFSKPSVSVAMKNLRQSGHIQVDNDGHITLTEAGMEIAITTDHGVTPLWLLPTYAGLCVREGLSEEAAFRAITINGAKALGVADRVGSIALDKDADLVVFSGHPFHWLTKTEAVFIDGQRCK